MGGMWVYGEARDGQPSPVTLELVSKAAELGEATVVFLGAGGESAAGVAGEYGAARALVDPNPVYDEHLALPAVDALAGLIEERQPALVLFATTYDSRDAASRLAARLDCGVVSNATGLEAAGDGYRIITPWGANTIAVCELTAPGTKLALFRPKAFAPNRTGGSCPHSTLGDTPSHKREALSRGQAICGSERPRVADVDDVRNSLPREMA